MTFRDDRDALLARNDALEREVADAKRALAEKERELERVKNPPPAAPPDAAQLEAAEAAARERANAEHAARGFAPDSRGKAVARKSLAARMLSVFKRAWVIVVFWMPVAFSIIPFVAEPAARLYVAAGIAGYAASIVAIDAYLRRCPACRRWLAGIFLRVVRDQYDFHVTSWRCTFCQHAWETQRIAHS